MEASVRKVPASVYANVGVHAGVGIELARDRAEGEGTAIYIGDDGPDLILDFADAESMELLSVVAAEGARLMRGTIAGEAM